MSVSEGGFRANAGTTCAMIVDVTSNGDERSPSRWRAFLVGDRLAPDRRRRRRRLHGIIVLVGVAFGVVGLLLAFTAPPGSGAGSLAAGLAGIGVALVVVAGIAVAADRLR